MWNYSPEERYAKTTENKKASLAVLFLMCWSTLMISGAGVEQEVGGCELALGLCAQYSLLWGYSNDTMVNCMIGYAFCKKYVES